MKFSVDYSVAYVNGLTIPDGFTAYSEDKRLFVYVRRESGVESPRFKYSSLATDTDVEPQIALTTLSLADCVAAMFEFFGVNSDLSWVDLGGQPLV